MWLDYRHLANVSIAGVAVSVAVVVGVTACVFHAVLNSDSVVPLASVPGGDR